MSNAFFYPLIGCSEPGCALLKSVLGIASDSSVSATTTVSKIGAWTKTGTGEYTLTLSAGFLFPEITPNVSPVVVGSTIAVLKSWSAASRTVVLNTLNTSHAAADPGAAALVPVFIVAKNSSISY